ncbi:alcohol dehydrogenase catalytic domain-containing protein [Actinoallomurus soli]|uniref:alcohol dehydrogenase catalytic domain-containing protein n=1 Tax=Actinoallomurus soli TaxID=2952535 RepID=UPI00209235B1|nr:alcohol dehydrogenase catalytic domain-containing protein [Actinoallomurus soli]MCO5972349.1 alcohol dehydrogenase catalytic domain-containing protein [Actinoallomurus soli]
MSAVPGTGPAAPGPLSVELTGSGPRLSRARPRRPDGAETVLVEPLVVGVCRSDLKEIAGRRPGPSQFGHELVGVVARSSTPRLPVGARVCLDPNVPVARGPGFARAMWVGGDADALTRALPLAPAGVVERRLVFAEPLACAAHCLTMTRRHRGGAGLRGASVCVLGAGTAGVFIARLAEAGGARVLLANRDADRLAFLAARRMLPGGGGVPLSESPGAAGPVKGTAGGHDVVVIATSFVLPELLEHALRLVRPGGLVMLYGGTAAGDRLPGLDCDLDRVRRGERVEAVSWRGRPVRVGGSYGTTPEDFTVALRALSELPDGLGVERLITAEVPLRELPAVLRRLAAGRCFGKVLARP